MFKKLTQSLERMAERHLARDPASFNDPVAEATEWTPAKGGGTNVKTHRLKEVHSGRLEFRAAAGAILFYSIFLLVGLGISIGFLAGPLSQQDSSLDASALLPVGIGILFAGIGGSMLYFGTAPIVFDTGKGWYWKGRKSPDHVMDKRTLKHFCELKDVHAIQLVSEYCRGNKTSYYSYELNLVLEDGRRINVIDHGSVEKIRADAAVLSAFIGKPVWDAA